MFMMNVSIQKTCDAGYVANGRPQGDNGWRVYVLKQRKELTRVWRSRWKQHVHLIRSHVRGKGREETSKLNGKIHNPRSSPLI